MADPATLSLQVTELQEKLAQLDREHTSLALERDRYRVGFPGYQDPDREIDEILRKRMGVQEGLEKLGQYPASMSTPEEDELVSRLREVEVETTSQIRLEKAAGRQGEMMAWQRAHKKLVDSTLEEKRLFGRFKSLRENQHEAKVKAETESKMQR